jgi:hypothetical protein
VVSSEGDESSLTLLWLDGEEYSLEIGIIEDNTISLKPITIYEDKRLFEVVTDEGLSLRVVTNKGLSLKVVTDGRLLLKVVTTERDGPVTGPVQFGNILPSS